MSSAASAPSSASPCRAASDEPAAPSKDRTRDRTASSADRQEASNRPPLSALPGPIARLARVCSFAVYGNQHLRPYLAAGQANLAHRQFHRSGRNVGLRLQPGADHRAGSQRAHHHLHDGFPRPGHPGQGSPGQDRQDRHNAQGFVTSVTDQANKATTIERDALNNVRQVIMPSTALTETWYTDTDHRFYPTQGQNAQGNLVNLARVSVVVLRGRADLPHRTLAARSSPRMTRSMTAARIRSPGSWRRSATAAGRGDACPGGPRAGRQSVEHACQRGDHGRLAASRVTNIKAHTKTSKRVQVTRAGSFRIKDLYGAQSPNLHRNRHRTQRPSQNTRCDGQVVTPPTEVDNGNMPMGLSSARAGG